MLYDVVRGVLQGVTEHHKQKYRPTEYENLRTTPYLHSSHYLSELTEKARNKHEHECVLDHLYRHHGNGVDVLDVRSYALIEKAIIDKYRRD